MLDKAMRMFAARLPSHTFHEYEQYGDNEWDELMDHLGGPAHKMIAATIAFKYKNLTPQQAIAKLKVYLTNTATYFCCLNLLFPLIKLQLSLNKARAILQKDPKTWSEIEVPESDIESICEHGVFPGGMPTASIGVRWADNKMKSLEFFNKGTNAPWSSNLARLIDTSNADSTESAEQKLLSQYDGLTEHGGKLLHQILAAIPLLQKCKTVLDKLYNDTETVSTDYNLSRDTFQESECLQAIKGALIELVRDYVPLERQEALCRELLYLYSWKEIVELLSYRRMIAALE